jgi:hypothetical protein
MKSIEGLEIKQQSSDEMCFDQQNVGVCNKDLQEEGIFEKEAPCHLSRESREIGRIELKCHWKTSAKNEYLMICHRNPDH